MDPIPTEADINVYDSLDERAGGWPGLDVAERRKPRSNVAEPPCVESMPMDRAVNTIDPHL
jgi:hypothetical protein